MNAQLQRGVALLLSEVAEVLGVTTERVRQIELRALARLRHQYHCGREEMVALSDFLVDDDPGSPEHVHCEVPEQSHERLGWGYTYWDSCDDPIAVDIMLARRAARLERRGVSRYANEPGGFTAW